MSDLNNQDAEGIDVDLNEMDNLDDFMNLEDFASLENLEELDDLNDIPDLEGMEPEAAPDVGLDALDGFDDPEEGDMFNITLPDEEEGNNEEDVDSMLEGLLDDLDTKGSLEEEAVPDESVDDMGDLLHMLGGSDSDSEEDTAEPEKAEDSKEDAEEEDLLSLVENSDMDQLTAEEPEEEEKEKKPGLMKRLFGNIVTDEIAEAERAAMEAEKEAAGQKEQEAAIKKEEAAAAKAAKAEEKAAAKAAKAEAKKAKKAQKAEAKAAKKAEREAEAAEELQVTGKLNKVGVSIIVVLTVIFLAGEISGTQIFSYRSTVNAAKDYLKAKKYTQAYEEILGTNMKKKDQETYDKIVTVMKVQRSLNAYESYMNMGYTPDALNSLLVGMRRYDENIEKARGLEVDQDLDSCREEILTILYDEFGLSEKAAYDILALEKEEYTERVVELGTDNK